LTAFLSQTSREQTWHRALSWCTLLKSNRFFSSFSLFETKKKKGETLGRNSNQAALALKKVPTAIVQKNVRALIVECIPLHIVGAWPLSSPNFDFCRF
jgi:hypothetical protein